MKDLLTFTVLLILVNQSNSKETLAFKNFKNCDFKIFSFSNKNLHNSDLIEKLIHINLHPYLILALFYTNFNTTNPLLTLPAQSGFCSLNILIDIETKTSSSQQRDSYLTKTPNNWNFATIVLIVPQLPKDLIHQQDYRQSYNLFLVSICAKEVFYICPHCLNPVFKISSEYVSSEIKKSPLISKAEKREISLTLVDKVDTFLFNGCSRNLYANTRYLVHCSIPRARLITTLGTQLNLSLGPIVSSISDKNGDGLFIFQTEINTENRSQVLGNLLNPSPAGAALLYCDFYLRTEQFSLSVWISPFQWTLWVALLVLLGLLLLYSILAEMLIKQETATSQLSVVGNWIFDSWSILLSQPLCCQSILLNGCVFGPLGLGMILIMWHYVDEITSNLIAPQLSQPYKSLRELLEHDFKLLLPVKDDFGWKAQIHTDYANIGMANKLNSTLVELGLDSSQLEEALGLITPKVPKQAVINLMPDATHVIKIVLETAIHKDKYNCYALPDALLKRTYFDVVVVHCLDKVQKMFTLLSSGGFTHVWEKWFKFNFGLIENKIRDTVKGQVAKVGMSVSHISFNNLTPLFVIYGGLMTLSFLVFLTEFIWG